MERVVVTGAAGLLGGCVASVFEQRGSRVDALDHGALDVTDEDSVHETIERLNPTLVVHCAAMTNVDGCEEDPDRAFAINGEGSHNVASATAHVGASLVAVSTDYVFDGTKGSYNEDDETDPIQVYGESKLAGEHAVREQCERHFIVRSAWIYGAGGKNFLSKLPDLSQGDEISAVNDQRGSPTYAPDLAAAIAELAATELFGTYHVVNGGFCTFAEFCRYALETLGARTQVKEVAVASLGRPAPRPHDTTLVGAAWARAGFKPLRSWRQAARAFLGAS